MSDRYKFSGAAPAANGTITFAPSAADTLGVFDLVDENFQLVDILAQVSGYYIGGAAPAANGKITLAPYVAIGVGVFDPADESFQLTDISAQLSGDYKFSGAAPLPMARSSLRPMPPMVWASSFLSMRPLAHRHLRAFERRLQVLWVPG